ncbi:MAG: DUF1648 domain-containing protein [Propioniciclava sp.]
MIRTLDELTPQARDAAVRWLDGALARLDPELRTDVRDELTGALCTNVDATATPPEVVAVLDDLGPLTDPGYPDPGHPGCDQAQDPWVGSFAGIPYDWRRPSTARIKDRLWDPTNEHLIVPGAFGAGWDLNFAALAIRLGIIEPDAEDVPFTQTPAAAFAAAKVLPVGLAAAVIAHYLVRRRELPSQLPHHWAWDGTPDRWVGKRVAAVTDVGLAIGAAGAAIAWGRPTATGPSHAGALATSAAVATAAAGVTVWRSATPGARWWAGPALALGVVGAAGATLLGLALAGRRAEQQADLRDAR